MGSRRSTIAVIFFFTVIVFADMLFASVACYPDVNLKINGLSVREKIKSVSVPSAATMSIDPEFKEKLFSTLKRTPEKNHDLAERCWYIPAAL